MKLRLAPNPRNYLSFFSYLASLCSSLVCLPDICLQIIILGNFTILVHVSFWLIWNRTRKHSYGSPRFCLINEYFGS